MVFIEFGRDSPYRGMNDSCVLYILALHYTTWGGLNMKIDRTHSSQHTSSACERMLFQRLDPTCTDVGSADDRVR